MVNPVEREREREKMEWLSVYLRFPKVSRYCSVYSLFRKLEIRHEFNFQIYGKDSFAKFSFLVVILYFMQLMVR